MEDKIRRGDRVAYRAEWRSECDPEYFTAMNDEGPNGTVGIVNNFSALFLKPWHIAPASKLEKVQGTEA